MQHPIQIDAAGGEYMDAVVILEWTKEIGAAVKAGEHIVTVETAKAATEVEAPADGFLVAINYPVGEEAPVGKVLGLIAESLDAPVAPQAQPAPTAAERAAPVSSPAAEAVTTDRVKASPLARRTARSLGVDLSQIRGTGPYGRVKRIDVENAAKSATAKAPPSAAPETVAPAAGLSAPVVARAAGVPVVLLHGFGADRSGWRPIAGLLDGGRQIITPELPGHGQAPAQTIRNLEELAFAVADDLAARGIETAHLVGHSLGGAVAVTLADLGLVAARSLCLIAPGGLGPEVNTGFIHGLANATTAPEIQPWLETMVADPSILPSGFAQAVIRARAQSQSGPALKALAQALFGEGTQLMRLAHRLEKIAVPAKVIWGMNDRIIPASHAADLPAHFGLHRLKGVGHVPQMEAPALVARLLNELHRSAE
ncbi:acetoin dehydrogenase dihydrolipoyllysine-residue acetyltransferase subunit [Xinfangfangia sp. CPCC 101601]|uniref:Acetoin dehydrogenase dihydrolipoyllysine-residue acetyltransferase subunit n=1 Tax=Pseudogemmobacter lacusdianii TaxID=3069608 RepID=A0ABU0W2A1_9RHOB|nr:acetoin dehydrogenase dihydrolipoyllysine-residue acetyltransferase subunit [Xinfangfangia sp. CPCC 101601]MDQ2068106.1 acetoin dehydrogenase dihydrolipoyllysine-residue acetyltransferase subunit [Xinfangfangia sp. CPCC 101601]